jgi:hypothetical protein
LKRAEPTAPADDAETPMGRSKSNVSLDELTAMVQAEKRQVVRMWHPDKIDPLIQAKNGSGIEVNTGTARYQLTTGEIIEV